MSASNYIAAPLSVDFIPSKEDRDFSHVFSAVYQLIEAAVDQEGKPQSERLALRLSTCRNAYLTANALYVDLIEVFGHGKKPSLMSSSLVNLQREKFSVSKKALDEISENLSHFEEKMKVWEERFILESILENALNSLNQLTTDEAIAIIQNVRQSSSYGKHRWERKYYELSTDEPSLMKEKLGTLKEVYASTKALLDVGRGIIHIAERIAENADLFTGQYDPIRDWNSILEFLSENAGLFGIGVNGEGVARILSWRDANGNVCELRHNTSNISRDQESLISLLKDTETKTYKRLASAFKANVGEAPLPQPFVVDLSDPSQGKPCAKNGINVERTDFHTSIPQNVKIAVSGFGVPLEYYNRGSFFRFDTESKRNAVFELAIEAIKTASSEDAAAIVFPEYFLPRNCLEEITRLAQEYNLILIGGLEGTQKEEKLLNQASVYFPSTKRTFFVPKHRNSGYEPNLFYSDTKHHVFERTPIGTFTVIVCSDFMVLTVLRKRTYLVKSALPHRMCM
jgi:hypothetical protein